MEVLVLTPTNREAHAIRGRSRVAVVGTGAAGEKLREAVGERQPDVVIIAGFCGGLDPSLKPGDIIVGRMAAARDASELLPEKGLIEAVRDEFHRRKTTFVYSRLLSTEYPVATKQQKLDLWNEFGAGGVDMETYALAEAAEAAGIPWIAVRVVIDTANHILPPSLSTWAEDGDEREALKNAIRRPTEWATFGRLGLAYRKATKALPRAVAIVRVAAQQSWEREEQPSIPDVS